MGSQIYMVSCEKCGKTGYCDIDFNDHIKTTGCDECGYKRIETYPNSSQNNTENIFTTKK